LFPASKSHVGQGVSENAQTPMRQHFQPAGKGIILFSPFITPSILYLYQEKQKKEKNLFKNIGPMKI